MYKECTNISDENALKYLSILRTDLAATWWQGVQYTINTWNSAEYMGYRFESAKDIWIQKTGVPAYTKFFSREQEESTQTDIFVCKARALLSKFPYEIAIPEYIQLDMIYGLLAYKIRKEIPREKVASFSELLDLVREVEETRMKENNEIVKQSALTRNSETRPRCKYCKNFGHTVDECRNTKKKNDWLHQTERTK
ncbi:hypothetical protein P5V15_002772 [Pogonomyrmex californicus]